MEVKEAQVKHFLSNMPSNIIGFLLYGADEGRVNMVAKHIKHSICKAPNITEFSAENIIKEPSLLLDEILAISFSMFGNNGNKGESDVKNIAIISNCNNRFTKTLKTIISEIPNSVYGNSFIILKAGVLKKTDSLPKFASVSKNIASIAFYEESESDVINFIKHYLAENNLTISPDAASILANYAKGNRGVLMMELDKMILYKTPPQNNVDSSNHITMDDIMLVNQDATSSSLLEICKECCAGNLHKTSLLLHKLFNQGENAIAILRVLQNYLKRIEQTQNHILLGKSLPEALKTLRPPVFFKEQQDFNRAVRKYSKAKITRAYQAIYQAELKCKLSNTTDKYICERALQYIAKL